MTDCAYNLFRSARLLELFCAVPEGRPVPSFLDEWCFVHTLQPGSELPPGFNGRAASVGLRSKGFYLFQATAEAGRWRTVVFADTVGETSAPRGFCPAVRLNDNGVQLAVVG